ncbi:Hint domain-containing protein [Yoonia sp. BS5-3]|uniref:Hint domain-containing protein n=1 Tax=Yoonia phaeophyticola TaxID=3137369 RepID=A0ABZ2V8D6_9RHOB
MPTIYTLEESNVTISGGQQLSGITQGDGSHLVGATITLDNNDWVAVEVDDSDDTSFGDSDNSQSLDAGSDPSITYNGATFADGLRVEAEYALTVQDPDGNIYTLIGFNINEPGVTSFATVEGLAFIGGVGEFPPIGVPLTVLSNAEGPNNPYVDHASPPCFTRGCQIDTINGRMCVEHLSEGAWVRTADNGFQRIRWINSREFTKEKLRSNAKLYPVRIVAGALGEGQPERDLLVSRQHRLLVKSKIAKRMFGQGEVLVAAIRLIDLPGVFVDETVDFVEYFHLLFDRHEIVFAEGAPTESLFTGPEALKSISTASKAEILTIFPELEELNYSPEPARFIPTGSRQKRLVVRHMKNGTPCLTSTAIP